MVKKTSKKVKKKAKPATRKQEKKEVVEEKPQKKVDIDVNMYRDLFKFLDEKVSVECFIDLHDQCFGRTDCECECHSRK